MKQFKPSVKLHNTFNKKRVKVGKVLKRANNTNTSFTSKKITIPAQLQTRSNVVEPTIAYDLHPRLTDICSRIYHYNENVRREALIS